MSQKPGTECESDVKMGRIGYRPLWARNTSILLRSIHQVGAAVFLAAYLLEIFPVPKIYLIVALLSGTLLFLAEWLRHRQFAREFSGVLTGAKLLLLGVAFHGLLPSRETVLLAFVLASLGAHAPKRLRHRLLF